MESATNHERGKIVYSVALGTCVPERLILEMYKNQYYD